MANEKITIQLVSTAEGAVVFSNSTGEVGSMPVTTLEDALEQAKGAFLAVEIGKDPLKQEGFDFAKPKM